MGKDLVAGVIHRLSHRQGFPYVKVGCTLFPPQLIESELYGHEKGSFTGADQRRKGRFDLAEGGTLYLDDVDDIPLGQQSKLLRAIEEKVFERVGGTTPIKADVRIIASTKRNLLEKIAEGASARTSTTGSTCCGSRSRPCASGWRTCRCWPSTCCGRSPAAARLPDRAEAVALRQHAWPGNVRELSHALERAYLVGGGHITRELLGGRMTGIAAAAEPRGPRRRFPGRHGPDRARAAERALRAAGGNKTAAAAALGMKPSTFRDKLAKHGLG